MAIINNKELKELYKVNSYEQQSRQFPRSRPSYRINWAQSLRKERKYS
jgi:hypothetical protein